MIPPLILTEKKDGVRPIFKLADDFVYRIPDTLYFIKIPKGFKTDFATIPFPFNALWSPQDIRWAKAALIHDYLYRKGSVLVEMDKRACRYNREFADKMFRKTMRSGINKTPKVLAFIFYWAVRAAGYFTWQKRDLNF